LLCSPAFISKSSLHLWTYDRTARLSRELFFCFIEIWSCYVA
jgi:hypothetical protein